MKKILLTALLSTVAAMSFAQAPAAKPSAESASAPVASEKKVHTKHATKKAEAPTKSASAAATTK
ncbi:MAG TPA: hypothetical protein VN680_12105 [Burkholderiaceae bacterium]|nr:hypothetical protein [Burkholderiaceae bacterium]